jgi:small subunit ribosomal protein S16
MLAIRLRRTGSKKRPFFRVVVIDSRAARDSSFVEVLGFYNPRTTPETLKLDRERLDHWVKAGAAPSDTVRTLVARMPEAPPSAEADQPPPAASQPAGAGPSADASTEAPSAQVEQPAS